MVAKFFLLCAIAVACVVADVQDDRQKKDVIATYPGVYGYGAYPYAGAAANGYYGYGVQPYSSGYAHSAYPYSGYPYAGHSVYPYSAYSTAFPKAYSAYPAAYSVAPKTYPTAYSGMFPYSYSSAYQPAVVY